MGGSTSGVVSDSFPQSSLAPRSQSSGQLLSDRALHLCPSVRRLRDEVEETHLLAGEEDTHWLAERCG